MAVPKKKVSQSRRNMRRSHDRLHVTSSNVCGNCNSAKASHQMCSQCGFYKGVLIKAPKTSSK